MTVKDAYHLALACLGEPKASEGDYEADVVVGKVNTLIWELWPYSTALRAAEGLAPAELKAVSVLSEEISLEEQIVRMPLVYGLASGLAMDDDEMAKASYWNEMKNEYLMKSLPAVVGEIEDVY
ncbi:MAG: hypothetical protein IJD13_03820 [Oscillospiraceae bacterium]|nr:hypothetical protein [Oscillospiraceae bacterium]